MKTAIQLYKDFIDSVVKRRKGVEGRWITAGGWPDTPANQKINALLALLSPDQREVMAKLVQEARDGGFHDALVVLNEAVANGLRLSQEGEEFAIEPFGTEMYYDWTCRCEGDPWPDEKG